VGTSCDAWYFARMAALLARRTSASSTGFTSSTGKRSSSGSGAEGGGGGCAEGGSVACRELWREVSFRVCNELRGTEARAYSRSESYIPMHWQK
jgi:hypothetical protein